VGSAALAVALGLALPAAAVEADGEVREGVPADVSPVRGDIGGVSLRGSDRATAAGLVAPEKSPGLERSATEHAVPDMSPRLFAQFQLPPSTGEGGAPAPKLQTYLPYQYVFGTDPQWVYRSNADLDKSTRDNLSSVLPSVNGIFTYRPSEWLEITTELQIEKEIIVHEEPVVTLPDGTVQVAQKPHSSVLLDQFHFTIREFTAPFALSFGRKGYEDERRSLLDGSMDGVSALLRQGRFRGEAIIGRMAFWDWEFVGHEAQARDKINTFYSFGEYRFGDDVKLGAFAIARTDMAATTIDPNTGSVVGEGAAKWFGLRALGSPTAELSYWAEASLMWGTDENSKKFKGRAYDIGFTHRFFDLPLRPNFTLGYAFGSGDDNPDDSHNTEFRQTGLQSEERRFAGVTQFLVFGEGLQPDLSNIKITTVGIGIRPDPQVSVDLVWHSYRLHKVGIVKNSAITAEANQVDAALSRDLGHGLDLVIGARNLFGVRRLGLDLRAGVFKPGSAYSRNVGPDPDNPVMKRADNSISTILIIWW
jgi:alginate production protein